MNIYLPNDELFWSPNTREFFSEAQLVWVQSLFSFLSRFPNQKKKHSLAYYFILS